MSSVPNAPSPSRRSSLPGAQSLSRLRKVDVDPSEDVKLQYDEAFQPPFQLLRPSMPSSPDTLMRQASSADVPAARPGTVMISVSLKPA